MSSIENTYTVNQNVTLEYPYAAKDTNNKLILVLGPASMTPCNALQVEATSIIPLVLNNTQINNLTLIPEGVTITMKVDPQYSA